MASSSSSSLIFGLLSSTSNFHLRNHGLFTGNPNPSLILPCTPFTYPTLTFARRKNGDGGGAQSSKKKKKKKSLPRTVNAKDDIDEDAFEALFDQLEEDLKNDPSINDSDDEISEEELARLEKELVEAFGDGEELSTMVESMVDGSESNSSYEEEGEEDEEDEEDGEDEEDEGDDDEGTQAELKNWQLRRLACALKIGRRKTSIKTLSAELGLDRALVLALLREPPPNLLMLSASLPDEVVPTISEPEIKPVEPSMESTIDVVEPKLNIKEPVHAMQSRWSAQKRLKKVQVATLERVYDRTKRPTNAMISSIVHVTNLPRKRVVKWFEDKREEDGIPDQCLPYQRLTPKTTVTS